MTRTIDLAALTADADEHVPAAGPDRVGDELADDQLDVITHVRRTRDLTRARRRRALWRSCARRRGVRVARELALGQHACPAPQESDRQRRGAPDSARDTRNTGCSPRIRRCRIGHLPGASRAAALTIRLCPPSRRAQAPPQRPEPESLALAAEFPAATRDEWRALVAAVLARSGADGDPEQALAHTTYDGILIKPLYTAEDAHGSTDGLPGHPPFVRGATDRRREPTRLGRAAAARRPGLRARTNAAVLADLENGATSLWLALGDGGLGGRRPDRGARRRLPRPGADRPRRRRAHRGGGRLCSRWRTARRRPGASCAARSARTRSGLRARTGAPGRPGLLLRGSAQSERLPALQLATVDAHRLPRRRRPATPRNWASRAAVGVAYLRALTERRAVGRRGARRARVPVRGDRRPVPVDRQAARRAPDLGPRRRTVRRRRPTGAGSASTRSRPPR